MKSFAIAICEDQAFIVELPVAFVQRNIEHACEIVVRVDVETFLVTSIPGAEEEKVVKLEDLQRVVKEGR